MNEWEAMQNLGYKEMESLKVGTRVRLRSLGGKITGRIVEIQPPFGICQPRYRCEWDDGDNSGWLSSSSIEVIKLRR